MSLKKWQGKDEELLTSCRQGDNDAWEALVNRYQRLIYTIPRRAGLDEDSSADVFQRTFTLLLQHIERIEQPDRLSAWLVTTARRETQRLQQRASRLQPLQPDDDSPLDDTTPTLTDPAPLPDEVIMQLEEHHLVRTMLAELDERCRNLLTLLFYRPDTPSYSEITAAVGIPAGSIGPTRARCLQKLGRLLENVGFVVGGLVWLGGAPAAKTQWLAENLLFRLQM